MTDQEKTNKLNKRMITITLLDFVKEGMIDSNLCDVVMRNLKDKPYFVNLAAFISAVKLVIIHL